MPLRRSGSGNSPPRSLHWHCNADVHKRGGRLELQESHHHDLFRRDCGWRVSIYFRLLARHLGQHLPGNPTVVVKNMPGAGGVVLANYLQVRAARDGTEFAALEHGTAFTPLLTRARVEFDPAKFGWLGSMEQFTPIAAVWHTVPVYSADDLTTTRINVGPPARDRPRPGIRIRSMPSSAPR